jgi:hypothetical protein
VLTSHLLSKTPRIRTYKTVILKQRDRRTLKTAEIKIMRRTAGYSLLDHKRNYILGKLDMDPIEKKSEHYKQKWSDRVGRMKNTRHLKQQPGSLRVRQNSALLNIRGFPAGDSPSSHLREQKRMYVFM